MGKMAKGFIYCINIREINFLDANSLQHISNYILLKRVETDGNMTTFPPLSFLRVTSFNISGIYIKESFLEQQ
jgi:hypothetical protein